MKENKCCRPVGGGRGAEMDPLLLESDHSESVSDIFFSRLASGVTT